MTDYTKLRRELFAALIQGAHDDDEVETAEVAAEDRQAASGN